MAQLLCHFVTFYLTFKPIYLPGVLKYFFLPWFLSLSLYTFSQNQNSKWYFGNHAGLDFATDPPTILTNSSMNATEESSSICDAAGNLLFYTNGFTVWNRLHAVMAVISPPTSYHSCLVVKQPGNTNIYFLFTQHNGAAGLRYSVIDMSLNTGLGAVTLQNIVLATSTTEALCGAKHCNGTDTWVISRDATTNFKAFLVSAAGVNATPVISNGTPFGTIVSALRTSPAGNKIVGVSNSSGVRLLDFNSSTGTVSNEVNLGYGSIPEFSPDGTKLYATNPNSLLLQWNLCAGSGTAIAASLYTIACSGYGITLAPNGKLYITRNGQQVLDVINDPNVAGAGCNFVPGGQSIAPNTSGGGLPNYVSGFLLDLPPVSSIGYTIGSGLGCQTTSFTAPSSCTASGYTLSSLKWDFDDPASGANNISTLKAPVHFFTGIGTYTVSCILYYASACGTATDTVREVINISIPAPTLTASGGTFCTTQPVSLNAGSSGTSFLWQGPLSFTSALQNPVITNPPTQASGIYTVIAGNPFGCFKTATVSVTVLPPPALTVTLTNTGTLCAQALNGSPNTITLSSNGASTYTLVTPNYISNSNPTGTSNPLSSLPPYITGVATATLLGINGICTASTTVNFTVIPNPTIAVTPDPYICAGETYTYTSNGADSFTWSAATPGSSIQTGPVVIASPTVTSVYSVIGGSLGCYSGTQTTTLSVNQIPTVTITSENPLICFGEKTDLVAHGTGTSYAWIPASGLNVTSGSTVSINPSGEQTYSVISSLNSCTAMARITVSVLPLPVPLLSVVKPRLCLNEVFSLSGSGGKYYEWKGPGNFMSSGPALTFTASDLSQSGTYTLTVHDEKGCANSTTTALQIDNLPSGDLIGKMEGCVPFSSDFSTFASTQVTAQWRVQGQNFPGRNFTYPFKEAGEYPIYGFFEDTLTHCARTSTFLVNAYPQPIADFKYTPEKPVEGLETVIFTNTSRSENQSKWSWSFVNNQGHRSDNESTSCFFQDAGNYPVALVVKNVWGCADTVIKVVTVGYDFSIYVPNVFTPNDDGLNDIFLPVLRGARLYTLSIFNRWGLKLFETNDPAAGWDGAYRGEESKDDSYIWKITVSTVNGDAKEFTGFVILNH